MANPQVKADLGNISPRSQCGGSCTLYAHTASFEKTLSTLLGRPLRLSAHRMFLQSLFLKILQARSDGNLASLAALDEDGLDDRLISAKISPHNYGGDANASAPNFARLLNKFGIVEEDDFDRLPFSLAALVPVIREFSAMQIAGDSTPAQMLRALIVKHFKLADDSFLVEKTSNHPFRLNAIKAMRPIVLKDLSTGKWVDTALPYNSRTFEDFLARMKRPAENTEFVFGHENPKTTIEPAEIFPFTVEFLRRGWGVTVCLPWNDSYFDATRARYDVPFYANPARDAMKEKWSAFGRQSFSLKNGHCVSAFGIHYAKVDGLDKAMGIFLRNSWDDQSALNDLFYVDAASFQRAVTSITPVVPAEALPR